MLGEVLHQGSDKLSVSPAYTTFSVLTVLRQGLSAAQWHDCHGEGGHLSLSPRMQNEYLCDQAMSLFQDFITY